MSKIWAKNPNTPIIMSMASQLSFVGMTNGVRVTSNLGSISETRCFHTSELLTQCLSIP